LFTSTWTAPTVRLMVPFTVAFIVPLAAQLGRGAEDTWLATTDDYNVHFLGA